LLEERLSGFEASIFFSIQPGFSKTEIRFLGTAQDFKRRYEGNEGPNTGGMGALSPHPKITTDDIKTFFTWAQKTSEVLESEGRPFCGILYLGVMKDEKKGWHLIEYNARPGDPETEALVVLWPSEHKILRSLLCLSVETGQDIHVENTKVVCLSLVRPEYPAVNFADKNFSLPSWNFKNTENCLLFKSESQTGRVAFLVGKSKESYQEAGDLLFETLVESPWRKHLEWRADLIP